MTIELGNLKWDELNPVDKAFYKTANFFTPVENAYKRIVPKIARFLAYPFLLFVAVIICASWYSFSLAYDGVSYLLGLVWTKYQLYK